MSLNADTLLDRIYLKAQARKWRILGITAIVIAVIASLPQVKGIVNIGPIHTDYIARIKIDEVILDDQETYKLFTTARDNDNVKAVVLWLDTPGGSAIGGEELYLTIRELAAKKPVVAVMRGMATSAGYMAAIGADHIIAREGTITGSIGVIIQSAEFSNLAEKLGITPVTIRSAPLKGTPSMFEKMSPEAEVAVQDVVDDFYGYFVDLVAERRKLPRDQTVKLADGRVYSGKQALDLKLIDQIGGEKEALNWLTKTKKIEASLPVHDIEKKKKTDELLEYLGGSSSKNVLYNLLVKLDGLVLIWHPNIL